MQDVEWCASTTLTTMSLGGMVQRGLDDERMMMDSRRMVELFGAVAVPMAGLARLPR